MGKSKKVHKVESAMEWPFEIDVNLAASPKKRIAFLSSQSRTYFPEDPGVSRFGIYYSMNAAATDVPNPKYFPSEDRLQKPISTKGFGIGGLMAPRFTKGNCVDNPAPNAYQMDISIPVPKRKRKSDELKKNKSKSVFAKEVPLEKPTKSQRSVLHQRCLQTFIGFGAHLSVPRFGKDNLFHNVGVGYYDLRRSPATLGKVGSFGNGSVALIPPTVTRCNYKGYDKCFGCDTVLSTVDYYRTRMKVPDPNQNKEEPVRLWSNEDDRLTAEKRETRPEKKMSTITELTEGEPGPPEKTKLIHVSLCRKCYCKGMRGECQIWDRQQLLWLFRKTRHCCYIHDHQNIPEFTHKTNCGYIRKIQLKEALMAKYYKDACERMLKEK